MYQIWSMFFCSIVSMRLHPGYHDSPDSSMLRECAEIADGMMEQFSVRFPEYEKCQ